MGFRRSIVLAWGIIAIAWAVLAPVVYQLINERDEHTRKIRAMVSGIDLLTRGQTNQDVTVATEEITSLAAFARDIARMEEERDARFARAMWLSSAMIVITASFAIYTVRQRPL